MRVRIGIVAPGPNPLFAEEALSARNGEGHYHTVASLQIVDSRPNILNDAHALMPEDVALLHRGNHAIEQMQVRAADRRLGDLEYRVVWIQKLRICHGQCLDLAFAHPANSLHDLCSLPHSGFCRGISRRRSDLFSVDGTFHSANHPAVAMRLRVRARDLAGFG